LAVFVELVTDAFESVFRDQAGHRQGSDQNITSRAGKPIARRPVRGIEIKEDTYAYLRVVMANGESLPLLDSSSPSGESSGGYTNFILQSVQEERMEKHQIVETFGEAYIFFFGESPRFLNITAALINTHDFNWRAEWWHNYEHYLRGTKLVELGARCYLFYDDIVIEGYILGAQAQEVAETHYQVSLNFRFFVTKYRNISLQNVQYYPLRSSANIVEALELTNAPPFAQAAAAYRGAALGTHNADGTERQAQVVQDAFGNPISEVPLPQSKKISQAIARNPAIAFDPDIWTKLIGTVGVVDTNNPNEPISIQPRLASTRGLIAENVDEYVSGGDGRSNYVNEFAALARSHSTRWLAELAALEMENLTWAVIRSLGLIGIGADNPDMIGGLGLGPNFSAGYQANAHAFAGASFGGGAVGGASFSAAAGGSAQASFSPMGSIGTSYNAAAGYGVSAGGTAGAFGGFSGSLSSGAGAYSGAYGSFQSSPLSVVYGASASASFGAKGQFFEGMGDLEYGYSSEFGGAGYGQAGYGDFGGNGFGGAYGSGDPGFMATAGFSFDGIAGSASASASFTKFTKPKNDQTALTGGHVLGGTALTGKGSVHVGGASSAFALVSAEGSIGAWAVAEASQNDGVLYFGPGATASAYATAGISL